MRRGVRAGFTLLEMLLALTLVSMIVGSILGGLHLGRRAWETGKTYETVGEIEEAARAIRAQFAHAVALPVSKGPTGQVVAFQGLSDSCRFVALSEGEAQWGGLILTEIGGDVGDEVAIWTRVFRPAEGFGAALQSMRRVSALRNAEPLRLSYFGEMERGRPPVWSDRWIDRETLPLLVGVRMAGRVGGRTVDVSFTVALRQR
jgi:general secretion pathway protein J